MIVFVLVFLFPDTDLAPTVQKTEGKVDNGNISEMKHQRTVIRGLNYESGLKRQAGLNLKAIDNGPKMVTMDRDYTKVRAEPRA